MIWSMDRRERAALCLGAMVAGVWLGLAAAAQEPLRTEISASACSQTTGGCNIDTTITVICGMAAEQVIELVPVRGGGLRGSKGSPG